MNISNLNGEEDNWLPGEDDNHYRPRRLPQRDVGHDLQLLRDLEIINRRTLIQLGPVQPVLAGATLGIENEGEEMKRKFAAAVLGASAVACQPMPHGQSGQSMATDREAIESNQRREGAVSPLSSKLDVSALQILLEVYSGEGDREWHAYDRIPGIEWREAGPVADKGASSPSTAYFRSGNILLAGFGMIDVPNGKIGPEADSRLDNEGNSGLTLSGTARSVESMAVMKFYASPEYEEILVRQLAGNARVVLSADECGTDDPEARKFFEILLPNASVVYVEAYVDAEGGQYSPGSTTFEFYRSKPTKKIDSYGCHGVTS